MEVRSEHQDDGRGEDENHQPGRRLAPARYGVVGDDQRERHPEVDPVLGAPGREPHRHVGEGAATESESVRGDEEAQPVSTVGVANS